MSKEILKYRLFNVGKTVYFQILYQDKDFTTWLASNDFRSSGVNVYSCEMIEIDRSAVYLKGSDDMEDEYAMCTYANDDIDINKYIDAINISFNKCVDKYKEVKVPEPKITPIKYGDPLYAIPPTVLSL